MTVNNMFDLEQKISEWRNQMLAAGIKTPVPLDELENHLREEIERQIKSGLDEQEVFSSAVQKIGQARPLKNEFQKTTALSLERIMSIGVGISTVLVGLWIARIVIVQTLGAEKIPDAPTGFISYLVLVCFFAAALVVLGSILVFYGGANAAWLPNARNKRKYV